MGNNSRGYVSGVISDHEYILPWSGRGIDYTDEDIEAVVRVMKHSDPQTQGQYLSRFENVFSTYHGGIDSFATSSGAGSLEISADLIDIKPGDEVIIPAHTYVASAIPYARRGAKLVWADIDLQTRTVSAKTIKDKVTSKTKAIVVVHLYGLCVDMDEIVKLAHKCNAWLIEDCAQALGSSYKGKKCGTFGHISIFSFHAQKNITTLGEGGMIATTVSSFSKKIPGLRHNGHRAFPSRKHYWKPAMVDVDFDIDNTWPHNFSIGEAQCALGISLMKRLDEINKRRKSLADQVINGLSDCYELEFQKIPEGSTHVYSNLCILFSNEGNDVNRDQLIGLLSDKYRIQPVVQNNPLYRYPMMVKAGFGDSDCPNSDFFFDNMLSLPFYEWYTEEHIKYLIDSVQKAVLELR
jgi:dTDP-4-amino-4,6-dideoxygalactose transaminase